MNFSNIDINLRRSEKEAVWTLSGISKNLSMQLKIILPLGPGNVPWLNTKECTLEVVRVKGTLIVYIFHLFSFRDIQEGIKPRVQTEKDFLMDVTYRQQLEYKIRIPLLLSTSNDQHTHWNKFLEAKSYYFVTLTTPSVS